MKSLCIIPARGGSKRIPRKNIRLLAGRPLLCWAIQAAQDSQLFSAVMVSTDDAEIAKISRDAGADVPFLRSAETANDFASTASVMREVLERYGDTMQQRFEVACCLYPTAALVSARRLIEGADLLNKDPGLETVMSVQRYRHPIERAFRMEGSYIQAVNTAMQSVRTQDLKPAFHDAGQFYWFRVESFMNRGCIVGPRCAPVFLDTLEAVDLDSEEDWSLLERVKQLGLRP